MKKLLAKAAHGVRTFGRYCVVLVARLGTRQARYELRNLIAELEAMHEKARYNGTLSLQDLARLTVIAARVAELLGVTL